MNRFVFGFLIWEQYQKKKKKKNWEGANILFISK